MQLTYIHTYLHGYLLTYIHTYLHGYLLTYIHIYLLTHMYTYLHRNLLTWIITYIHAYNQRFHANQISAVIAICLAWSTNAEYTYPAAIWRMMNVVSDSHRSCQENPAWCQPFLQKFFYSWLTKQSYLPRHDFSCQTRTVAC